MSEEFSRENVMARILAGRKSFEATLARVPEKDMQAPILHDGWSVKDTLGHLGYWEEATVTRFNTLRAGETPEPITDMDALNARVLSDSRQLSLEDVRRYEQESYRQLVDMVQNASSDELFKPGYFAWAKGNAFAAWIGGNTWEHYEEHLPDLVAWLSRQRRAGGMAHERHDAARLERDKK